MSKLSYLVFLLPCLLVLTSVACQSGMQESSVSQIEYPDNLLVHVVDLSVTGLTFFYKNKNGENYANHGNLKNELAKADKALTFAVNGGMYNRDHTPQGLFIENGIVKTPLDTASSGYGNFYLQPNGVFFLTKKNKAGIVTTKDFVADSNILFATQSGPMLLTGGKMHPKFRAGSANLHIRNGVGILPDGKVLFVMSKEKINFYDFASYFKKQGCLNALYLDGFVSRTYLPAKNWEQLDGNFGVIIGTVTSR